MLDMLPQELFENPDTKFLDPACKTGVFLREIAKRLLVGLEKKIPELQERIKNNAFNGCSALTIYCEVASKPSGWENNWNISNCPTMWGQQKDS